MSTDVEGTLESAELTLIGRILPASNSTLLAHLGDPEDDVRCVYKPIAGEAPLWDFPDGTLAFRERAAYLVSQALGWDIVPPTVLRNGPLGTGMVQLWCEPDPTQTSVDVVPAGQVPEGYLHVLDALGERDRPVSLIHEDTDALRRMAVFDVLVNNTDRKGGHVLAMTDGHRFGVDHGVCFHHEDKLRTVLWGWAGRSLTSEEKVALDELAVALDAGAINGELAELLTDREIDALWDRCDALPVRGMPLPGRGRPSIPWPPF